MATDSAIHRALGLLDEHPGPSVVLEDGHGGLDVSVRPAGGGLLAWTVAHNGLVQSRLFDLAGAS